MTGLPVPRNAPANGPSRGAAVTATLRDEILRGQYRAGERLPSERDLALRFDIHRGAVREALKKLEQLGLAEIRPGGARVAPLEEASLDVVEHLLGLSEPPDLAVVEQVLEVFSGLFAMSTRFGVERANEAQRARADEILCELETEHSAPEAHELMHELAHLFVDASQNLVLKLVRRALKSPLLERARNGVAPFQESPPLRTCVVRKLRAAVRERNGSLASECVYQLTDDFRHHAITGLAEAHSENAPDPLEATS